MTELENGPGASAPETPKPERTEPTAAARLPLVATIAAEYADRGLPLDELVGAGVSGLELSVELGSCPPDTDRDAYAAHWIRRGILGALAAKGAVDKFVEDFQAEFGRRPNLAEVRSYRLDETGRMDWEIAAYVRVSNDFVDDFLAEFGHLPTIPEAEAFGQARREQLKNRLGAYISSELLVDERLEDLVDFEPGPLHIPDSWLAGLDDEPKLALVLRYGLDGSGVKEVRAVGSLMGLKTRKVGEIINQAIIYLAEENGIATENLLIYPNLFDGLDPADRKILAMRLGVLGFAVMEVREVAEECGVSCETVRNTEWRAICYTKEHADHNLLVQATNQRPPTL